MGRKSEVASDSGDIEGSKVQVQSEEEIQQSVLGDYQLTSDRTKRKTKEPSRYQNYLSIIVLSY